MTFIDITEFDRNELRVALEHLHLDGQQLISTYPFVMAMLLFYYRESLRSHEHYQNSYSFLVDIVSSYTAEHQQVILENNQIKENIRRIIKNMGQESLLNFNQRLLSSLEINRSELPILSASTIAARYLDSLICATDSELLNTDTREASRLYFRRIRFTNSAHNLNELSNILETLNQLIIADRTKFIDDLMLVLISSADHAEIQYRINAVHSHWNKPEYASIYNNHNRDLINRAILSSLTLNLSGLDLSEILGPLYAGFRNLISLRQNFLESIRNTYHSYYMIGKISHDLIIASGQEWTTGICSPINSRPLDERNIEGAGYELGNTAAKYFTANTICIGVRRSINRGIKDLSTLNLLDLASIDPSAFLVVGLTSLYYQKERLYYAFNRFYNNIDPYQQLATKFDQYWARQGYELIEKIDCEKKSRIQTFEQECSNRDKNWFSFFSKKPVQKSLDEEEIFEELLENKIKNMSQHISADLLLSLKNSRTPDGSVRNYFREFKTNMQVVRTLKNTFTYHDYQQIIQNEMQSLDKNCSMAIDFCRAPKI